MNITTTDRLSLRLLTEKDAEFALQLLNDPLFIKYIGDKQVRDIKQAKAYLNSGSILQQEKYGFSMYCCQLKACGTFIGFCGIVRREGIEFPELGFAFLSEYNGLGFGYESSCAVLSYAKEHLKLTTLQAICDQENKASIKLLEKCGFGFLKLIKLEGDTKKIKLYQKTLT